jgi:hypothetical protein
LDLDVSRDEGITLDALEAAVAQVRERVPEARLKVSGIGNIAVIDQAGEFAGWIDMEDAQLSWVGE